MMRFVIEKSLQFISILLIKSSPSNAHWNYLQRDSLRDLAYMNW